jgi:hypothetical protein
MAKRFTDTDKWKKKFIRSLEGPYKLLWLYILDECDHAGVWIVDFDVARLRLGDNTLDETLAEQIFSEKILKIDSGDKWLILDFIEFQYGVLNEENRAHTAVIKTLKHYGFWDDDKNEIKKNKPLVSPLQGPCIGPMDKEKEKEKEKDKDKEKEKGAEISKTNIFQDFTFADSEFQSVWKEFKQMRVKLKKPITEYGETLGLKELQKLSGDDKAKAIAILQQSIKNSWQGLFPLKDNYNGTQQSNSINKPGNKPNPTEFKGNTTFGKL